MRRTASALAFAALTFSLGACADNEAAPPTAEMTREQIEQAIMPLQASWPAANLARDCAAFDRLFADDFVSIGASGTVVRKAEWLERCRADQSIPEVNENVEVELHSASPAYAVTTGLNHGRGRDAQGNQAEGWTRWTNVWAYRDGGWVVVAAHNTPMPARP
jgi:ketosteroid isomerase-like protein